MAQITVHRDSGLLSRLIAQSSLLCITLCIKCLLQMMEEGVAITQLPQTLKNTGVVTVGIHWSRLTVPTGQDWWLYKQTKSHWMGNLGACELHASLENSVQLCNQPWCWNPFLSGIVVNPKKKCCCSSLIHVHAWHSPVSFPFQCVLCISENLTAAEDDYLNTNVCIIQRNGY